MANNEVKVIFAGDASQLERSTQEVGTAVTKMSETVDRKTQLTQQYLKRVADQDLKDEIEDHFKKPMEKAFDASDKWATRTGTLAGSIGALSGGLALLGVNADSTAGKIIGGLSVAVGTLSGVLDVVAIATEALTGAQWAENLAFLASPITWIILIIVALVAVIVLIATKTDWFQKLWKLAWEGIKTAAKAIADWFSGPFVDFFVKAWDWIVDKAKAVWEWFKSIPGLLKGAFDGLFDIITGPFRAAFNFVADAWNNTIGRLSWSVPSWVPIVGGKTISAPHLPHFHSGGVVPGMPGQEVLAVLQAGETVTPAGGGGGDGMTINLFVDGVLTVQRYVRANGGNVQLALGNGR